MAIRIFSQLLLIVAGLLHTNAEYVDMMGFISSTTPGEVDIAIVNTSGKEISVIAWDNIFDISVASPNPFLLTDMWGRRILLDYTRVQFGGGESGDIYRFAPGGTFTRHFRMQDWIPFTRQGLQNFTVQFFPTPFLGWVGEDNSKIPPMSNGKFTTGQVRTDNLNRVPGISNISTSAGPLNITLPSIPSLVTNSSVVDPQGFSPVVAPGGASGGDNPAVEPGTSGSATNLNVQPGPNGQPGPSGIPTQSFVTSLVTASSTQATPQPDSSPTVHYDSGYTAGTIAGGMNTLSQKLPHVKRESAKDRRKRWIS